MQPGRLAWHALRVRLSNRQNHSRAWQVGKAHYDLGNDFYGKWLDPDLTYSSGIFDGPRQGLAAAQANKYRRIAAVAGLQARHHVLEIGCGWGGFATYAAQEIGCRVTAITISDQQHALAAWRVQEAGLADRVDWRASG